MHDDEWWGFVHYYQVTPHCGDDERLTSHASHCLSCTHTSHSSHQSLNPSQPSTLPKPPSHHPIPQPTYSSTTPIPRRTTSHNIPQPAEHPPDPRAPIGSPPPPAAHRTTAPQAGSPPPRSPPLDVVVPSLPLCAGACCTSRRGEEGGIQLALCRARMRGLQAVLAAATRWVSYIRSVEYMRTYGVQVVLNRKACISSARRALLSPLHPLSLAASTTPYSVTSTITIQ